MPMAKLLNCWLRSRLCWRAFKSRSQEMQGYYRELMPLMGQDVYRANLMALDLEMTGLDPNHDQILSIGIIPIEAGMLKLDRAQHKLIRVHGSVGQSATIHGILDRHLQDAIEIEDGISWFLAQTRGKVLVAHHAPLDISFLQDAISRVKGEPVTLLAIDTLAVERRRLLRKQEVLQTGSLRLGACRIRYGLPIYGAHDALVDALACGELLLAQICAIAQGEGLTVGELVFIK
ncbi:exonuclease domain-containing protein [Shewanella violacea]|uniref:Exonuclease n=2 Tax=Shewanella violacea TaxID=60217 RepID=D4ZJ16_SHEVD|nr:exonuclease [Shewanella violacea DSS12]